ncbi:MAG: hypothetical protein ABIS51_19630, partial [Sphingomonas sp.]
FHQPVDDLFMVVGQHHIARRHVGSTPRIVANLALMADNANVAYPPTFPRSGAMGSKRRA